MGLESPLPVLRLSFTMLTDGLIGGVGPAGHKKLTGA
jgi:hypothetical protein